MLHNLAQTILLLVATLFPIINPPASGFIVLSMVPTASESELAKLARRIAINSFVILLTALYVGAYILTFFGISVPVLRVSGGIVLAMAGWSLLNSGQSSSHHEKNVQEDGETEEEKNSSFQARSFYPLTLPITVGPGAIAVAIALATSSPPEGPSLVHFIGVGVAVSIISISIYLSTRFATRLQKLLGATGSEIAMRMFAFILFCIGVQIFWLGMSALLQSLHST